jgi:hypothetical protein
VASFLTVLFSFPTVGQTKPDYSEPFDVYPHVISWNREILNLNNLSIYMRDSPNTIAYLGYWIGEGDTVAKARKRAERAKRYLVSRRKVAAARIVLICAGRSENSSTSIYVATKGTPGPKFAYPCR